jgi:FAD synthetase
MRVLVFGTFDRLHPGHRFVFEEAQKRGEVTAVVARDTNVQRFKGRAPEQNETERREAIEREYPMITAVLGEADDFFQSVTRHAPDLILLGYDQKLPPGITDADFPCPVERLPAFEPERFKSSKLRK